jgi:hypothetical protein
MINKYKIKMMKVLVLIKKEVIQKHKLIKLNKTINCIYQ